MESNSEVLAYRVNDVPRILGLGRSTIYKLISEKKLKSVSIAGRTLIPRAEIERLVSESLREEAA